MRRKRGMHALVLFVMQPIINNEHWSIEFFSAWSASTMPWPNPTYLCNYDLCYSGAFSACRRTQTATLYQSTSSPTNITVSCAGNNNNNNKDAQESNVVSYAGRQKKGTRVCVYASSNIVRIYRLQCNHAKAFANLFSTTCHASCYN